jgi:L-fuconolactonase
MIVDAHHHFWDPSRAVYPWMTPDLAPIARPFAPHDLVPLMAASGVGQTVLVQTRASIDETREFLALAADSTFVRGVVGWVDLTDPAVGEMIDALRAGVGGDRLKAIRHQVHDEPDPDWLLRADVQRGLRAVAAAGLAYDLLVRPRELPAAIDTVRANPDLGFVLDHIAKPPIGSGTLEPWAGLVAGIAALDNVTCKLSGMVTEADLERWQPADLEPFVTHVLEVFGPNRLLFGSDWPVCLLAASYERVVETAQALTATLSQAERELVFAATARRVYALEAT